MNDLPSTIAELQTHLSSGKFSAPEALQLQSKRLSNWTRERDGYVEVFDLAHCPSPPTGPLSGVGLAHKDIFHWGERQAGLGVSTGGDSSAQAIDSAPCIEALHLNGATQLGALHMAAYACGATSQNEFIGECINPLDGQSVVGGSSSGSAVAVARELCFASLGTDTAGSIRMPAATCGLVGLKTTMGLLSTLGVAPLAPLLDTVGIVARSALDVELVLRALKTPSLQAQGEPLLGLKAPQDYTRVQCWLPSKLMDEQVAQAVYLSTKTLPHCTLTEDFPEESSMSAMAEIMLYHQVAQTHHALIERRLKSKTQHPAHASSEELRVPQALEEMVLLGWAQPSKWGLEAMKQRSLWRARFQERFLKDHDLMVMPCIGIELPKAAEVRVGDAQFAPRKLLALHRFMNWVNYLGLPSLSMPIGADAKGMPISVQVLARPCQELSLLRWAQTFIAERFGIQNVRQLFPTFA